MVYGIRFRVTVLVSLAFCEVLFVLVLLPSKRGVLKRRSGHLVPLCRALMVPWRPY